MNGDAIDRSYDDFIEDPVRRHATEIGHAIQYACNELTNKQLKTLLQELERAMRITLEEIDQRQKGEPLTVLWKLP